MIRVDDESLAALTCRVDAAVAVDGEGRDQPLLPLLRGACRRGLSCLRLPPRPRRLPHPHGTLEAGVDLLAVRAECAGESGGDLVVVVVGDVARTHPAPRQDYG